MKYLSVVPALALVFLTVPLAAQTVSPEHRQAARAASIKTDLPIDSPLYQFALALEEPGASFDEVTSRFQVRGRADGQVKLEVVGRVNDPAIDASTIEGLGGQLHLTWRNRATFWIPADRLLDLARVLPTGYFIEDSSRYQDTFNEFGEELTGSDSYIAGGDAGQGLSIAVLDVGFANLTSATASGWAPFIPQNRRFDYTGDGFEAGDSEHGNLCLQTIYDHAPGAQYWALKISNLTEFGLACTELAILGIDIVSISLGYIATGWDDDTGSACAGVQAICDAGSLVFNSSGNYADVHWQGVFNESAAGSPFHVWDQSDELLGVFINKDETLSVTLTWDTSSGTDLDLKLWDNPAISIVAQSSNVGSASEGLSYPNPVKGVALRFITVEKVSGPDVDFEIICRPDVGQKIQMEYKIAGGSTVSPTNCTDPNLISVGAVQCDVYDSAPGTGGITTYYSSQGPTNNGALVPDLVAPTGTDVNGGGGFIGTSCSCPNAAGTAAALWSSAPYLSVSGLKHLLFRQSELFKDWGPSGYDTEYGWGGLSLYAWHNNTVWIDRLEKNPFQLPSLPFTRLSSAQNFATPGGRLLILGGSYPEPIVLNKQLRVETAVPIAVLGD